MKLVTERYTLSAGLGRAMTFAFVSDLHDSDGAQVLDALAACATELDAVLVGGDVIHNHAVYQNGVEFLTACAKRWKTFCCIGNHERYYTGDLASLIGSTGAVLLDNEAVVYGNVVIGGVSSGFSQGTCRTHDKRGLLWRLRSTPPPDTNFLERFCAMPGYKLLLCHHPEYWKPYVKPLPIDLTLSGHAHGGQWRLFGQGIFSPGQGLFPRYTSGLYHGRLLVSRGIGNPHHRIPRIANRPMIALITLT